MRAIWRLGWGIVGVGGLLLLTACGGTSPAKPVSNGEAGMPEITVTPPGAPGELPPTPTPEIPPADATPTLVPLDLPPTPTPESVPTDATPTPVPLDLPPTPTPEALPADVTPTPVLATPTPDTVPQIANPASKHCIDSGGRSVIRTAADGGQVGFCIFPDGSECEEWAFFRGECKPGGTAIP